MNPATSELFKALFIVSMFASVCGLARLAFLPQLALRLRLTLGAFVALMLLPSAYLYARLAFPAAANSLVPFQALAIWMYGPLLLGVLHLATHQPVRRWQAWVYALPAVCAFALQLASRAEGPWLPPWWELLALLQASVFATAALIRTVRRRAQLRILMNGFPGSSFRPLLYLSAGLLALLMLDSFVHWCIYISRPLSGSAFYFWVTPVALYSLGISLALIWSAGSSVQESAPEPHAAEVPAPVPAVAVARARKLELSATAAHELTQQLETLMREQRLHTRNDLTLVDLANALDLSTHLTSELLNGHLNSSFYEFVNGHRTTEAAALLLGGQRKYSIADVAYEAGFNNLNTFYREFKRAHGMTPAQFRAAGALTPIGKDGKGSIGLDHAHS